MSDLTKRLYKIAKDKHVRRLGIIMYAPGDKTTHRDFIEWEAADEIKRLQKRVSDADECIEEQEEMLEHLIVDQGQYEEEIERLQKAYRPADMIEYQELVAENERLRAALAKSCEGGRDEMYDCGYNRLRSALERIANPITDDEVHWINTDEIVSIAREALEAGDE